MGQLSALFYKNWVLYKRSIFGNIIQLAVPILFMLFVVLIRNIEKPTDYAQQQFLTNTQYAKTVQSTSIAQASLKSCPMGSKIALVPASGPVIDQIKNIFTNKLGSPATKTFNTEAQLESQITSESYSTTTDRICYAIVVDSATPTSYKYKLRFNITNRADFSDGPSSNLKIMLDQALNLKLYSNTLTKGMIGANTLVNSAILQSATANLNLYLQNNIAPVYQEAYVSDKLYESAAGTIDFLVLLPLLLIYLRQTSTMLNEKQTKIRQSMSIMGMRTFFYYFSWFFRYFMVYLVLNAICSILFVSQMKNIPFFTIFILYLLFMTVLIVQNFFIQVFLTRAKIGVVISLLFFVVQYVLSFIATNSDNPTAAVNRAISIIPHAAFAIALKTLLYAESNQIIPSFTESINNYSLGIALISFCLNILFYLILTWYLDQVIPNQFGAKKHPLFCCFDKKSNFTQEEKSVKKRQFRESDKYKNTYEPMDQNLRTLQRNQKMIEIVGLKKQFDQLAAVDDVNINMYNNQIFALLGHNGAGKTTTISMLTGMIQPTQGYIEVFGQTKLEKIRQMIGVCPQHDTLYEDLTVQEHLYLYASFKGLQSQQLDAEIIKLINDVNLRQKKDQYAKNLSGGQKRRLSVAIAFAGRSKVIILDEPTSGMDTSARRYIWELLKTYKNDRIILLTTHFMDEADYLGDRIGIMGGGKMVCCGSSLYLKNQFGVGYNITFSKKSNQVSSTPIVDLVKKYSPNAKILSNIAIDLSMQLPMEDIQKFPALFDQIDNSKERLGFNEYGISITTLQQVFLRVGQQLQKSKQQKKHEKYVRPAQIQMVSINKQALIDNNNSSNVVGSTTEVEPQNIDYDDIPRQQGFCSQFCKHFTATVLKRLRIIKRDFKGFMFELLLPIIIMIFGLMIMRVSFIKNLPNQQLTLNTYLPYGNPVVVPIASNDGTYLSGMKTAMTTANMDVSDDTSSTTAINFDQNYLFPRKKNGQFLLGGLFFQSALVTSGSDSLHSFNSIVNTRIPTSFFYLQTLAAQSILRKDYSLPTVSIQVSNYPLPRTFVQQQINNTIAGFLASFVFALALAFKFASIISFIVKEREDRSKHQQLISGMKISSYWFANFTYDFLLYLIVAIAAMIIIKALDISALASGDAYSATWLLFVFFGASYIWFTYIFAFVYKDYGNAQAAYYFTTFVAGGMLPLLPLLLRFLSMNTNAAGRGIAWVLRLFPAFAFGQGLLNTGSATLLGQNQNGGKKMAIFHPDIALGCVVYLIVFTVVNMLLLFLIEYLLKNQKFMRCCSSEQSIQSTTFINQQDVLLEAQKAKKADPSDYEIITKNLRKVFKVDSQKKFKIAVDNLSFTVKKGEVFGLLGINGAGKSTTFKMLSGQITSTAGDSYFRGMKISQNLDKVRESLGYCPQFDALIENLTVREQLQLFYDLKSLSSEYKDRAIDNKIKELNLGEYQDKLSGTLSGGNKRKLSVAMAMIGNPKIIFLDEPSTGMDPKARRFMWKVISRVATQKENTTVILTTHSMEEAQALSSRLGIMVKGNFQCIGSAQHIKSKYGNGYEIQIKLNPLQKAFLESQMRRKNVNPQQLINSRQNINLLMTSLEATAQDILQISQNGSANYIHNTFTAMKQIDTYTVAQFAIICRMHRRILQQLGKFAGNVQIIEKLQSFMRLKVPKNLRISKLFEFFQTNKNELNIQQYTIKQATVEQIFNTFAQKEQESEYNG